MIINEILIPGQKTIDTGQKKKNFFLTDDLVLLFSHDVSGQNCVPLPQMHNQRRKKETDQVRQRKNKPWQWLSAKWYEKEIQMFKL